MNKLLVTAVISTGLIMSSPALWAKKLSDDTVKISQALQTLEQNGFTVIKKIEFDDGQYVAKVVNNEGKTIKLRLDGKSGKILNQPKATKARLTALEVAKKVEQAGYNSIYKIDVEWFKDKYAVEAYNEEGKKVELNVNATTGDIVKD